MLNSQIISSSINHYAIPNEEKNKCKNCRKKIVHFIWLHNDYTYKIKQRCGEYNANNKSILMPTQYIISLKLILLLLCLHNFYLLYPCHSFLFL